MGLPGLTITKQGLKCLAQGHNAQNPGSPVKHSNIDSRPRGREFEPHRRHCVVVLEQDTFILAKYWFNPGRPVPV